MPFSQFSISINMKYSNIRLLPFNHKSHNIPTQYPHKSSLSQLSVVAHQILLLAENSLVHWQYVNDSAIKGNTQFAPFPVPSTVYISHDGVCCVAIFCVAPDPSHVFTKIVRYKTPFQKYTSYNSHNVLVKAVLCGCNWDESELNARWTQKLYN